MASCMSSVFSNLARSAPKTVSTLVRPFKGVFWPQGIGFSKTTIVQDQLHLARSRLFMNQLIQSPVSLLPPLARGAKIEANKLRRGQVISLNGKTMEVVTATHTQGRARQAGNVQVELRDLFSGTKGSEKFSPDDVVETRQVLSRSMQYLYTDQARLVLMDPLTFEQMEVDEKLLGGDLRWICEKVPVVLSLMDGAVVAAAVPERVELTVMDAEANNKGAKADGKNMKSCTLENGVQLEVPGFIQPGETLLVDTATCSFVKRSPKS